MKLTPLQERLYDILGRDIGEPLPGVRHNPLSAAQSVSLITLICEIEWGYRYGMVPGSADNML